MEIIKESIPVSRQVCNTRSNGYVEGSIIVPDVKPDIERILQVTAATFITNKDVDEGRVSLEGKVRVTILYLADDGGVMSLEASFDYSDRVEDKRISGDVNVDVSCKKIEYNIINSRKIGIRAVTDACITACSDEIVEYPVGVECEGAEIKMDKRTVNTVISNDSCSFVLNERVELPNGKPSISEILLLNTEVSDRELRQVTGKVIAKGVVNMSVLYKSDKGSLEHFDAELPFTEVFEAPGVNEDTDCRMMCKIHDNSYRMAQDNDGDMRIIELETEISARLLAEETREIEYLSDCYICGKNTELEEKTIEIESVVRYPETVKTIRETLSTENIVPKISAVYNMIALPVVDSCKVESGNILINGKLTVTVLYLSESKQNPICSFTRELPFSYKIDAEDSTPVNVYVELLHASYNLNSSDDVEIRCAVCFCCEQRLSGNMRVISDIKESETKRENRVIISRGQKGENIWDIAKKYSVSQAELCELNEIESDELPEDMRIIIPC